MGMIRRETQARGVLLADNSRPRCWEGRNYHNVAGDGMWTTISSENHTVRIRDIIRLLIAHGGDVDALSQRRTSAFDLALSLGFEQMVNELLLHIKKVEPAAVAQKGFRNRLSRGLGNSFREQYITLRNKNLVGMLEKDFVSDEKEAVNHCFELLALQEFNAIEKMADIGVDFAPTTSDWPGKRDFLTTLVQWGYSELLEIIGAKIAKPWANGLENPGDKKDYAQKPYIITPYLLTAVQSQLPNLEVIKLLVEKFAADVNKANQSRSGLPGDSALHTVSHGTYWWHTEAVSYLLSRGADPELRNERGQTALHTAVSNDHGAGRYQQHKTAALLLEHGADPNAIDNDGLTCLNKAIHDIDLVWLLIKHKADITLGEKPVLFSAIAAQDLPTVKTLLQTGANCNIRQKQKQKEKPLQNQFRGLTGIEEHECYPVHYAASCRFDIAHGRDAAIKIVQELLCRGADPFLEFKDGVSILHHILSCGGILQPFLEIKGLDLEKRDSKGQSLLLAACSSSRGTYSPSNFKTLGFDSTTFETRKKILTVNDPTAAETLFSMGADLTAIDNEGNNALHLLILAIPHNDDAYKQTFSLFLDRAPELVKQKNKKGYTPYHYAVQKCRVWTSRELVTAGADPLEQDPEGNTSLHYLVTSYYWDPPTWGPTFTEFLALGVSINTPNHKGETPLFNYFRANSYWRDNHLDQSPARTSLQLLEEAGTDLFVRNHDGKGLLHIVAKKTFSNFVMRNESGATVVDTFKFLMEKGLDPMIEDKKQRSALDVAAACGNHGILDLFKRDMEKAKKYREEK